MTDVVSGVGGWGRTQCRLRARAWSEGPGCPPPSNGTRLSVGESSDLLSGRRGWGPRRQRRAWSEGPGCPPQQQRGATLVEAAIALPILVLFVLGLVDMGLWAFQSTQASSGARDGARAGILRYQQADVPTSTDAAAIRSAIERRIGAKPFGASLTVQVRCLTAGQNVAVTGGCAAASVINRDRVEVTVTWPRQALSFVTGAFGTSQTVRSKSAMVILGRPSGVTVGP